MTAKILVVDIETSPLISMHWSLNDQFIAQNQMLEDWHILSYAAKWLDTKDEVYSNTRKPKIFYQDQRNAKDITNDKTLLKGIWKLMDEADVIIWQNGSKFDKKRLNARFILNGLKPPSSYKELDTLTISKKYFGFTSHSLEYMTKKLCKRYVKKSHKKFPGITLWKECLKGNKEAFKEMEDYNKYDILSLEELYHIVSPWDNSYNPNIYTNHELNVCKCGSIQFKRNGFHYTATGKYQRYKCLKCGSETRDRKNLFSKDKLKSLRVRTK